MAQPLVTITNLTSYWRAVQFPNDSLVPQGTPSYFDFKLEANAYFPDQGWWDGWCLNPNVDISGNNESYSAYVYSSYELSLLPSGIVAAPQHLDELNWLLNQSYPSGQYNYGEVQSAIWNLMGYPIYTTGNDIVADGPVSATDVQSLVNLAIANPNFVPDETQYVGVVFDVFRNTTHYQPIIGKIKAAALGDYVWEDLNVNGLQDDGNTGINGVTVKLVRDLNNDGDFLDANEVLATTTTGDNPNTVPIETGYYKFKGLTPGLEYQVVFNTPTGYSVSPRQSDSNPASNSNSDGLVSDKITLSPGEFNPTIDAGFYRTASLGDRLWLDTTANGKQDDSATGISGQLITLIGGGADGLIATAGDNTTATTTTGVDGFYQFTGLTPGVQYEVQFSKPAGYVYTGQDLGGDDTKDSDVDATGLSQIVTLASGEHNPTIDAGVYQTASLGDRLWLDTNANGKQDDGATGISGQLITLIGGGADGVIGTGGDDTTATTTTGTDGFYQFTGLTPGVEYQVQFTKPAGYVYTGQDLGGDDTIDSDVNATGLSQKVTLTSGQYNPTIDAGVYGLTPGIDIEKTTNGPSNSNPTAPDYDNEDAANGSGVPILTPGSSVTWTYKVTNTGQTNFAFADVAITDDNGTPGNTADDLTTGNGQITFLSVQTGDADNILEPGEEWLYKASGIVQNVTTLGAASTFDFNGSSGTDGADGNVRTFTAGAISVHASAFSRDKTSGAWSQAWLGSYGGGLGVTDNSEGSGGNNTHTVDNMGGRDNYVLFEFDQNVVVDSAFLGYVVNDSDMQVWIGSRSNAYANHDALLSDADLTALGFTELNSTTLTTTRLADLNAGSVSGNVLVIAADTTDTTPEDMFKIQKLTVAQPQSGVYENKATVTAPGTPGDSDLSHYKNPAVVLTPKIDIEKTTNGPSNSNPTAPDYDNEDAANGLGVPILTPGSSVTWTYKVTNTGNTTFAKSDVAIVDDNGTPGNTADDLSVANGKITYLSGDVGNDNLLSPGEEWLYKASGIVQNVTTLGAASTFDFNGSSGTDGADGNVRTFTAGAISVHASAFSRDKTSGAWSQAWLGSYGGGLGVTDSSEGSGGNNTHTVDNMGGRDNYVLFEFDQNVVIDSAYLGYVVNDSDMQVWIGSRSNAYANHDTLLSDADLTALGFTEINSTTLTAARLADLNAGNVSGNVLVIAADTTDATPEDMFKIQKLTVAQPQSGIYENKATVAAPGAPGDSDLSHYKNPAAAAPAQIGNLVWCDTNGNGIQEAGEPGICGVTVKLLNSVGAVVATTTTDTSGNYKFSGLAPGDYQVQFVKPAAYGGFTKADQGANDAVDSDANVSTGMTILTTLVSGENDTSWDAGLTPPKVALTYDFSGSTATSGAAGNTKSYTVGGVTVTASAFSRTAGGLWDKAYLGAYGGGHGVTDTGETGANSTHTVDNVGRINYVMYQFSQKVVVDQTYLGYVSGDSDLTAWIGSSATTLTSLSDALLAGMTKEANDTTATGARWADINAANKEGNILVIAASTSDTTPDDYFKIKQLSVCTDSTTVTPIAIDLDGHGIATVASADSGGKFDLLGNGQPVASGWLAGGEGFLAVDSNHNGKIDSISELFGGGKQGDGFAKLIAFDSNGDLVVDARDAGFVDLSVWCDANGNHQTDAGELMSLAEAGVVSLNVDYRDAAFMDANGNLHLEQSSASMADGTVVDMTDIYFAVAANDAAMAAPVTADPGWLFG